MLVEQSQPGERIGYCLQEHTYIAPEEGNSQMTFVLVKQEEPYNHTALHSAFKQEEVESAVVSEQALNNNSDSLHTSLKGTENEGTLINQECSTEETTLAQDDGETRVVLEAPCLGTSSHSDGAQSQTSDPAHSIVISLAAIQDSIKEEYEVRQEISEIEAQVPQQCQRDGETLANGQTVTVQPHAEEQLTQSLLVNKEVACEKVKNSLAEDDATSKTNLPVRRRRGRPPKNLKQKEMLGSSSVDVLGGLKKLNTHSVRRETVDAIDRVNSSSPMASQASPIQPKETFIITPSVQENQMANIAVEDMENREVVSLPASALSLSSSCSSEEPKNPETQKLPMEVEEEATHSPSTKVSSGNETVNNPTLESSQATTGQHKERRTSVTLQDAMLLVEAMNQSTTENLFSSSLRASRPQIRCPSCVGTLQAVKTIPVKLQTPPFKSQFTVKNNETHIAFVIPKHQHVSSNAATQTIAQPSPHLLTPIKLNIERAQSIVVPRVGSSHIIAATPPTKVSMTESKATHNNGFLPTATATSSPLETPSLSSHPQKTDATSGNSLPVSQLTNPSADPKSVVGPRKKIIVVPRQVTVSSKLRLQTAALAAKLATTVPPEVPVAGTPAQLISTTQELSKASADALSQKRDNTADNLEHPKQTASVSETVSAPTETCSSVKQSASVFQATQPTVEKKLNAVVRLTKLPFFVSPEESVLVSRLLSKGFSEGTTQENPSKPAISETPLLSSDICLKLIETPVSLSTPQKSDESNIQKMTLSSETSSVLKEAPVSESVQLSATSVRPALNVDNSEVQKNDSPTIIQLTSVSKEVSDPHLQMTKTQFLAQLAVSPIVQEPEKKANSDLDTRTCEKKRSQKNFLVSRLRSHLKTHLQTRRTETKPEGNSEIETTTVSHEKLGLVNDTLNDENLTKEPSPVTLKKTDVVENNTALHSDRDSVDTEHKKSTSVSPRRSCSSEKTVTCKKTKSSSVSPRRFSVGTDGVGSKSKKSCSVSPRRSSSSKETDSPEETKSTSVSPRRSSLGTDGVSSKNKKSSSVSPRRSTSGREDMDSHNKNSSSLRPRSPSRTKERASPKITKNGTSPRNTNANSVSPLQSTKEGARTKQIKSPSVSPTASNSSQSGTRKSSGFTKGDSRSKRIKKEPSSFSITADGTVTKRNNSETGSPSVKSLGIVKNSINPKSAGDLTPAKKPRLIQDVIGLKKGFQVVKTMKLAKAAKVKRMAKMRECNKSKLQTSRLSESQTNCEVKKCRAKLWMPPVMTEIEINKAREKDSSLLPVKTETGSNDQNLGYSPSVLPSFVPSPIVSPLQPLSVIGRHLLRNQCGECGRILSSSAALQSHVSLHTGHRPFSCTFCGKSFPDSKSFKRHGRVHRNGRIHICQHCGKGFVYRFGLTKHIQMVHGRLKPFICHICNKGFFTKRDVEVHIRIHTGEKPFQCTLCERRFTRRVELNMHLRWHNGEKRHWCPYCGKGFLDYNNLKRHKYTHTGEKPYTCPHCPKKFTQTGHLKKHVKNVHSE